MWVYLLQSAMLGLFRYSRYLKYFDGVTFSNSDVQGIMIDEFKAVVLILPTFQYVLHFG